VKWSKEAEASMKWANK